MKKILSLLMLFTLAFAGISCDDDDNSVAINEKIRSYINVYYPGAKILEAEYKYNFLEVDIYHDSLKKEVYFDHHDIWVLTTWDIAIAALPDSVTSAIATAYPDYRIDDAEYADTPEGVYYSIDLERGEEEIHIYVAPDGTIRL